MVTASAPAPAPAPAAAHAPPAGAAGPPALHALPAAEVWAALASRPQGLRPSEAAERLGRSGPNAIREVRGRPLVFKLLANFTHLMALLLWAGGAVGFVAGMPQLGVAIWLVNLINGAFSFWQEYRAERATAALKRLLPAQARVLRDGVACPVPAESLVPGDVLLLAEGDHVSADARLVEEAELRVDQSTLTGESHPVRKTAGAVPQDGLARSEQPNLVFAGTTVAAGTGRAVVCATGMGTAFGTIAHLTQTVGETESPLQREMARVTRVVAALATGIGVLFFVLAVGLAGVDPAAGFVFAMGMIVAFVPEGMLPTVTLSLAMGVQRMAGRHALIKRLSSVEALGSCTVICTDKTGTLTQNEMTVRELWVAGRRLTVTGTGYAPAGQVLEGEHPVPAGDGDLRRLLVAGALCSNARLLPPSDAPSAGAGQDPPAPGAPGASGWTVLGDPTEAALQVAAL
jgi:magnesium-transporting ATPase (P-type)